LRLDDDAQLAFAIAQGRALSSAFLKASRTTALSLPSAVPMMPLSSASY
jgi:hypothetical protein